MPCRVLLVDDDEMLLASMRRCLGLSFDLDTSFSGPAAIALLEAGERYSVIVTDMRMPKMDGVEFIRLARSIAPESKYVMLTGNQDAPTAVRAINEGRVFRFLNKPCDPDEIARTIEEALREYEAEALSKERLGEPIVEAMTQLMDMLRTLRPEMMLDNGALRPIAEAIRVAGENSTRAPGPAGGPSVGETAGLAVQSRHASVGP